MVTDHTTVGDPFWERCGETAQVADFGKMPMNVCHAIWALSQS